ncbi:transcriptional regulator [Escherichia coli]|nr:transcriptional regulator [Escherichia coli]
MEKYIEHEYKESVERSNIIEGVSDTSSLLCNNYSQLVTAAGGLLRGEVNDEHFRLLVSISSIHSEKVILALKDYLVDGRSRKYVCDSYKLNNGYFSVSLSRLTRISQIIARIVRYYK